MAGRSPAVRDRAEQPLGRPGAGENPHIPYSRRQRGHVRCEIDRRHWRTDFQVVPYVSRPEAGVVTDASFVVEAGHRGVQRA